MHSTPKPVPLAATAGLNPEPRQLEISTNDQQRQRESKAAATDSLCLRSCKLAKSKWLTVGNRSYGGIKDHPLPDEPVQACRASSFQLTRRLSALRHSRRPPALEQRGNAEESPPYTAGGTSDHTKGTSDDMTAWSLLQAFKCLLAETLRQELPLQPLNSENSSQ